MMERLFTELLKVVDTGASSDQLVAVIRAYKDRGGAQHGAQAVIERLRETKQSAEIDERLLDLLDLVTGFCSPQSRIWGPQKVRKSDRHAEAIANMVTQDWISRKTAKDGKSPSASERAMFWVGAYETEVRSKEKAK